MNELRIHTHPQIAAPAQLGVDAEADLFEPERWVGGARLEWLARGSGVRIARIPLPGTPLAADASASLSSATMGEAPRGAGTGWLRVVHFERGGAALWGARVTEPRSTSLAARAWNLFCYLGSCGIAVPEALGFWERGGAWLARESLLVLREPEGWRPLAALAREASSQSEERRRGIVEGVEAALERLARSRCVLPALGPDDLWVEAGAQEPCVTELVGRLQEERRERQVFGALERRAIAGVLVNDVTSGRLLARPAEPQWSQPAARIRAALDPLRQLQ